MQRSAEPALLLHIHYCDALSFATLGFQPWEIAIGVTAIIYATFMVKALTFDKRRFDVRYKYLCCLVHRY
ncbi:hypothetical protein LX36DRAFT_661004 [Colletotrichum falcatum]|nr:hypothetical protein LX36DRAFT_661004 [Colletotrichum falcatum]